MSEALNLEAAVLGVCSVCARALGGWSQVISGVVTLGCLSPRPARAPPWVRAGVHAF